MRVCEWPYFRSVLSPRLLNNHASFICVRLPFVHRRFLQDRSPRTHTIIEAHPDVYAACARKGWDKKEGVRVLHGRWQEVLAREMMISQDTGCVRLCVARPVVVVVLEERKISIVEKLGRRARACARCLLAASHGRRNRNQITAGIHTVLL